VSQRVKALERRMGQVLVQRSKPCRATEAGGVLVRLAGQWALLEQEATRQVAGAVRGPTRLAIVVNADSLATWFPPALAAMPVDVRFEVHREDQDHSAELLRAGSVMAAVTTDPTPVQGCRVRALGAMRYLAVASADYCARWLPDGATPQALADAPLLAFNRKDALQERFLGGLHAQPLAPPVHHVPSSAGFLELVRRGLGWGMVPLGSASAELTAGRLVDLAPGRHLDVPLHWQHWALGSSALDELTGHVLAAAREGLLPPL
jgi:LysR family transcriptional regulator (chromosome initiation inhibitor)